MTLERWLAFTGVGTLIAFGARLTVARR